MSPPIVQLNMGFRPVHQPASLLLSRSSARHSPDAKLPSVFKHFGLNVLRLQFYLGLCPGMEFLDHDNSSFTFLRKRHTVFHVVHRFSSEKYENFRIYFMFSIFWVEKPKLRFSFAKYRELNISCQTIMTRIFLNVI